MSTIRKDLIHAALNRASALTDYNIYKDFHKQYEFMQQTILADNSLTEEEKIVAIRSSNKSYDKSKIFYNEGTRRVCENCNQKCLATLYCEYCVRNYLKYNFSNWTSGNYDIDNLIQKCQTETLMPSKIVEWIPYNNLQNIKYLTRGGFSEIYTAGWINGRYDEWDSNERKLIRVGAIKVILKQLENVESADQSWFEEARSYLTISNKHSSIVQCFGLTQDPSNGTYMLVMKKMDIDLRNYLQQNHDQLTWKERIKITFSIIDALYDIHIENLIHRDLHFGNILYSRFNNSWRISDLGFCGPPDKPLDSIYGNLPYIAPEVIAGKRYTLASDIYSIAMLMWEISSGQPPFINYEHDSNLAINIIDGMRPKIISEIPSEYKSLMEQCWDADPLKRPDTETVINKMNEIMSYYQNKPDELPQLKIKSNNVTKLFTSKIHIFKNLREPKNATEEEQEAFHSKFSIPHNIDDFGESSNQYMSIIGKSDGIFKVLDGGKKLYSMFNKSTKNDNKNDYNKKRYINEDDDERYDPNLCSEEQDS